MLKLSHPITSINGFKIGDKVRLKDGDGRPHIIKSFSIDGMKEFFFEVQFEDGTETMLNNIAPLTSNLDVAAEEYAENILAGGEDMFDAIADAFKAGSEWKEKYLQPEQPNNMIQWTGNNLKEVIDFTGKSPRFGEWFKSWEEYENYVHSHNNILKLFCEDGSHYEVAVGAWIVKTPDGYNLPSVAKYIQREQLDNEDIDKVAQELYEQLYELKRRNNIPTNLYNKQEIIELWKAGIEYGRNYPKPEQPESPFLIKKAILLFNNIAESAKKLSAGNVSHLAPTIAGMAIRGAEFFEKRTLEAPEVDLEGRVEKYFGDYWKNCPLLVQRELINFARTFIAQGYILAKAL